MNKPSLFPRVFVYGTLKKNFPAHGLLAGAAHLGECFLIGYGMRHCGNYPAAFPTGDVAHRISGEVYELSMEQHKTMLESLDRYEGVGSGLYSREEVTTAMFGKVFVYTQKMPSYSYDCIEDGTWRGQATQAMTVVGGGPPPLAKHSPVKLIEGPVAQAAKPKLLYEPNDLMTLLYGGVEVIRKPKIEESKNDIV